MLGVLVFIAARTVISHELSTERGGCLMARIVDNNAGSLLLLRRV